MMEPHLDLFMRTPSRFIPFALVFLMVSATGLSGCMDDDKNPFTPDEPGLPDGTWVTGPDGEPVDVPPLALNFTFSDVGETGPEPSIGITSDGCMFFTALEKVMRSCDHGGSWTDVTDYTNSPTTSDPYLWVDPATDRVFNLQMMGLFETWIAYTDNGGDTWGQTYMKGHIPLNDHIKLGTGPWTDAGYGLGQNPTYDQAVYFCYNKLAGVYCYTSFNGGATFELGGQLHGAASYNGGLHGAITSAPDGTVYVPPRVPTPTIIFSKDNGLNWEERTMGEDVGTPNPRKNAEVATDSESNAYHVWIGGDEGVYISRSTDSGETWEQSSIRISPKQVISTTFPHADAGDRGRVAFTYLGSEDKHLLGSEDIDGNPWNGNPHYAPAGVTYYLYVTYTLNALDDVPVFHTRRVSPDPVQAGSICLNSGDCRDIGGSNRNLLDFNDLHIDREGRVYVAFADGCTGECATKKDPQPEDSRSRRGSVHFLDSGVSLYEDVEDLEPF